MSKIRVLIMMLCASLCAKGSYAQSHYALSLEQLFSLADKNSKALKVENAAVTQAQQDVRVAKNSLLPDIEVSLSASYLGNGHLLDRDFGNGKSIKMPHFGNNFALQATQVVYGGGAIKGSIDLAKLKEKLSNVNREATRSNLYFMLTGYYLELCKLHNMLKVYELNIELAEVVLKDTKTRNQAGVALQNDVTRYELQLKNLLLARRRIENSAEIINYDLVSLLGLPSETFIQVDTTLANTVMPMHELPYWQQLAQKEAYALQQTAINVEIGECNERIAKAQMRPNISLIASNRLDGPITIEVPAINKNFNHWFVGVGITYKLSSLYKTNKTIKQAELSTELSRRRQEEIQEKIDLSIQADYTRLLEAHEEVATLEKNVELATENYQVVRNRYSNDIALVTDMLDASNQLLDAELQLANAKINVVFNYYKLKNTSGNL